MPAKVEEFIAARKASSLSLDDAASACGIAKPTYYLREKTPTDFRLGELVGLYSAMNEPGQKLMLDAIVSFFSP